MPDSRIKSKRNSSMLHNEPERFIKGGLSSLRKNKFKQYSSFLIESDSDSDIVLDEIDINDKNYERRFGRQGKSC